MVPLFQVATFQAGEGSPGGGASDAAEAPQRAVSSPFLVGKVRCWTGDREGLKKEGQGMTHPAPWGTSPDISQHRFWRPGRVRTSTGARLLEVHQVSRQRREKASQKSGQHIPEEVLHGVTLLSEDGPGESLQVIS